jgi:site-specific DNA-methyltransferase (cytosine-N4-specific)
MISYENNQPLFDEKVVKEMQAKYYPVGSEREKIEKKFNQKMFEELNLNSHVSYVANKKIPILRLYRYKEAFGFNFVQDFLKRFNVSKNDYVFDPFSGMGTTLFGSFLNRIGSVGVDKLPIAYFTSKTLPLFLFLEENRLRKIWLELVKKIDKYKPAEIALDVPIMEVAFDEKVLRMLRKIKSGIMELDFPYKDIFLLLFFSILEECSFAAKDGQYLRLRPDKKISNPVEAMQQKVLDAEDDIRKIKILFPRVEIDKEIMPDVYYGDTRDLSDINFTKKPSIILTSPPYVNRYDYSRTYSLELCFHFVKNFEELKKIRFGILRSHIESKIEKDEKPNHPVIEEVVKELDKKKLNNPRIPYMLTTYFIDMEKVIKEWHRVLAEDAKVAMVVDNVRFEGEIVPVDLVLSEFAENNGFKVKKIIIARYKGNSSQQMKKYGRVPVRESIVVWEK